MNCSVIAKLPWKQLRCIPYTLFDHFMQDYERELVRLGLMPDESAKTARWKRLGVVQALLSGIAITKIALAIERGHLAFVRADNIEIGHLASPPRTASTIDSTSANLAAARGVVGSAPLMENIATLIDPPASDRDEPEWLCETLETSDSSLLLDLHNLYVNSINFGLEPMLFLQRLPVGRIHAVHIAGGRLAGKRILDDHLHDPPDPVFGLLAELAARCPNPLSIILERDGAYPPMQHILWQLGRARAAVQCGRARSAASCNILLEADCPQQTVSA